MRLLEARDLILAKEKVCDHCLGRQFHNKFKDHTNDQIGAAIRKAKTEKDIEKSLKKKMKPKLLKTCVLCGGIFAEKDRYSAMLKKEVKKHDFQTLLIGSHIGKELIEREEKLAGLACAAVLVDQHHCKGSRSLRWDLVPVTSVSRTRLSGW